MKLEYISKSQEYDASGQASFTKVTLGNSDGALLPVFLSAEKINLSNTELLNEALEKVYQENFPMRAENEKFNLLGSKIAEVDATIEKANATIQATQTQSNTSQKAFLDMVSLFYTKGLINDDDLATITL